MSLKKSCSCRFLVPVEMTTRLPERIAGNQIRQRLAGAGAGFDDQVLLLGERAFHGFGHLELARRGIRNWGATPRADLYGRRTGGR